MVCMFNLFVEVENREEAEVKGRVIFPLYLNFWQPSLLLLWYSCFYHPSANQREFVWAVKEWHEISDGASQEILSSVCLGLHYVQLPACPYMHVHLKEQHICSNCINGHLNLWMLNLTPSSTWPLAHQAKHLFQPVYICEWRSKGRGDQGNLNSPNMLKATRLWQLWYQVSNCFSDCNLGKPRGQLDVAEKHMKKHMIEQEHNYIGKEIYSLFFVMPL